MPPELESANPNHHLAKVTLGRTLLRYKVVVEPGWGIEWTSKLENWDSRIRLDGGHTVQRGRGRRGRPSLGSSKPYDPRVDGCQVSGLVYWVSGFVFGLIALYLGA